MPEVLHLRAEATHEPAGVRDGTALRQLLARLPHSEIATLRAALAVVALAIVDDAYVHPELGVKAGDKVVSGLVPLALITLLIATADRLPNLHRG